MNRLFRFRFVCRIFRLLAVLSLCLFAGCFSFPLGAGYRGPVERPGSLEQYYTVEQSYQDYLEELIWETEHFNVVRYDIETNLGTVTVDYFRRPIPGEELIFVYPILGGRNKFANYFAAYFARYGFDTAVVHRSKEFKDPENFELLETIFRDNVIRDRIAIDFFEQEFGKKHFGTFGISRGAINAAISAGVDSRLEYNVFAMGGADLVRVFQKSEVPEMEEYRQAVMKRTGMSEEEFFQFLRDTIRTDPKEVASYIDARNTLLFLAIFDQTVPFKYGLKLRREIGYPRTEFLLAGHFTSVGYTQFVRLLPLGEDICLLPVDYVETEALQFYRKAFGSKKNSLEHVVFSVLQAPFTVIGKVASLFY
jgi:hypothetical protein